MSRMALDSVIFIAVLFLVDAGLGAQQMGSPGAIVGEASNDERSAPGLLVESGHVGQVTALAFSSDSAVLATGSADGKVLLWNVGVRRLLRTLPSHFAIIQRLQFTPDGRLLVGLYTDGTLRVWDAISGQVINTNRTAQENNYRGFAIHPLDGSLIVLQNNVVRRLRPGDFQAIEALPETAGFKPRNVLLSPSGKVLVVAGEGSKTAVMEYWDWTGRRRTGTVELPNLRLTSFSFHPRKDILGAVDEREGFVAFFEFGKKANSIWVDPNRKMNLMAFGPDGVSIATSTADRKMSISAYPEIKCIRCFEIRRNGGALSQISPPGLILGSGKDGTLDLEDTVFIPELTGLLSPSGRTTILTGKGLFDLGSNRKRAALSARSGRVRALAFSPNGAILAIGVGADIELRSTQTGEPLGTMGTHSPTASSIALSRDGRTLAIGHAFGGASIWRMDEGRKVGDLAGTWTSVTALAVQPAGNVVASGHESGHVKLWDTQTLREAMILVQHQAPISAIAFTSDRNLITADSSGDLVEWELPTGRSAGRLKLGSPVFSGITDLRMSPDGTRAVAAEEGKLHIVALSPLRVVQTIKLPDPTARPKSVSWALDGASVSFGDNKGVFSVALSSGNVIHRRNDLPIDVLWSAPTPRPDTWLFVDVEGNLGLLQSGKSTILSQGLFIEGSSQVATAAAAGFFAISSWDGRNMLLDWEGREMVILHDLGEAEFAVTTPEGYYTTTRAGLRRLSISSGGGRLMSLQHAAPGMNRPDKILERLGFRDSVLFRAMHDRSTRESSVKPIASGNPEITVNSQILRPVVSDSRIPITVHSKSSQNGRDLKSLHVRVNGVPIGDPQPLSGRASVNNLTIPLVFGRNRLEVITEDMASRLSRPWETEIFSEQRRSQPRLFFFAVGISRYPNPYSVLSAHKDAQALAEFFKSAKGPFAEVLTKVLDETESTVEGISKSADWLQQSGPDDVVIAYFGGHGEVGDDQNYSFLTLPKLPSAQIGRLSHSDLESLLTRTHALRRLLLIDTCHSGLSASVRFPGLAAILQDRFVESAQTAGIQVLTATSQERTAADDPSRGFGLFSHFLLQGLRSGDADLNWDGHISVGEASRYTVERVVAATKGQQVPSARRLDLDFDFDIALRPTAVVREGK